MEKRKIDLQLFADKVAVQGKQIIILTRVLGDTDAAVALALETENSISITQDATSTATKSGSLRTPGTAETEISTSSVLSVGDVHLQKMQEAMNNNSLIELWRVNLAEKGTGANKYKGTYYQGYMTSLDISAPADGQVDVSQTFGINGTGEDGECTVTKEQVEEALYAFKDTVSLS